MNIKEISEQIHKTAITKGWWDQPIINVAQCPMVLPRSIGDQFANCHAELSEAWEEYRKGKGMDEVYYVDGKPEGIPIEIADCIIRLLDICAEYKIDIEGAIREKMAYNGTRSYRHGGKLA